MDQPPEFFYQIFYPGLPRLGVGSNATTRKALQELLNFGDRPWPAATNGQLRVLEVGCGNGAPTIELALHLNGTIQAVDNHQPFLDELERRAEAAGVTDKIQPALADMRDMGLADGSFDLIWCEGAIFIMGFAQGLRAFHGLLVPGGRMAISELCWLRPDPPEQCREFLTGEYPTVTDIAANLAMIQESGFQVLGHFILPESTWWEELYNPLAARVRDLRRSVGADPQKTALLDMVDNEIEMYRKYSDYYGHVFYLMRRPG